MISDQYLTKSLFTLACSCPTKLFYSYNERYANSSIEDPFLSALADGGFQVGALAQCYFSDGIDLSSLDTQAAIIKTRELLTHKNVTIFEAAFTVDNLLVRVDILKKTDNQIELIEVKAKSYSGEKDNDFVDKKGKVMSKWLPYIQDVAFQRHVISKAHPQFNIQPFLMLVNKLAVCETSGLHQKFKLVKDVNNRKGVRVSTDISTDDLNTKLLKKVSADKAVITVFQSTIDSISPSLLFHDCVSWLSNQYRQNIKIIPVIGSKCKTCQFVCSRSEEKSGKHSGFKECWQQQLHWSDSDFNDPNILDIWNFGKKSISENINNGIGKIKDVVIDEALNFSTKGAALTSDERIAIQVEKVKENDRTSYFDAESIGKEMSSWRYPLHFIDFETNASAIPFYKGMSPYEMIMFQFSHHIVHENGDIEHKGQFLQTEAMDNPNYEFLRELKMQLEGDNGTIFMYSNHENTCLNTIYRQLLKSSEQDKEVLCDFIKTITRSTSNKALGQWHGERCMVDLLELVKHFYYDPSMKGSNSIKYVLPAILNSSEYLKDKYAKPVYGSKGNTSLNFNNHQWIEFDESGQVIDPYKSLPKMFTDASEIDVELLTENSELNNGGLALTAFARMQFTEMGDYEKSELTQALLNYCELDTLAMVMIFEAWQKWVEESEH